MRLPRVVAGLALIVGLATVAVPVAGSWTPFRDQPIDPALFLRVDTASRIRDTAATTFSLDPAHAAATTLAPGSTLIEPPLTRHERRGAALPSVPAVVVAVAAAPVPAPPVPAPPAPSTSGWRRDASASWYGPGFYGHRTACGKTLTTTLLGVAHKTLPCGTMVSFRNPANGQTITVPVVDRGPYVAGRNWDLTAAMCRAIGHCYTGPILWRFP